MDLRTQTSLIAAVLSLALVASVLLRARRRRVHWLFGLFGLNVAVWYLSTFLLRLVGHPLWERINLVCAILLPLGGVQFFRAFIAQNDRRISQLTRTGVVGAVILVVAAFSPFSGHIAVGTAIFVYVVLLLFATLGILYARGRAMTSRTEGARARYLAWVGALAALFTLADYLPYVGLDIPPVGTVLVLVFLYALSQSILRYRLLDLYDLAGRLAVLTALSFTLAGLLWALVFLTEGRFFVHAVVAALAVLLLFDPLRIKVEQKISQVFFRERYDLEQTVASLRRRLARVLELDDLTRVLLDGLEQSRRATQASIYLVDHDGHGYDLAGHFGPQPPARIERAPARPLLDRLEREGALVVETIERELSDRRDQGDDREAETLFEVQQTLDALQADVVVPIESEPGDIYGLLAIRDDRLRDAISPEEVQLLRGLAAQAAIAVENSRLYRRMKERDRLAALGEMSAGLAHEIRNPLGAIKASAQYLAEEPDPRAAGEFIDIIVEEVDRLDRVVSSFLDYARPASSNPTPIDVNVAVGRTAQLLLPECEAAGVGCSVDLDERISPVRIDAERLRQVLINLVQNAVQAMDGSGRVGIETRALPANRTHGASVEIRVSDTGPGVPQRVLRHLFVPFVTTKDRGVGLGLAVCQRLVAAAGGTIEVKSPAGAGTTFIVRLPAANDATRPPSPSEAAAQGLDGEASAASAPESPSGSDSAGGPSATREPTAMAPPVEDRASTSTTNR